MTTAALLRVAPTSSTARNTKLWSFSSSIAGAGYSMVATGGLLRLGGLAPDGDCLEVGGGDRHRVAVQPVVPPGEVGQVVLEGVALRRIERREGVDGRSVPAAEEGDEVLGGRKAEGEGALDGVERRDAAAEEVAQVALGTPEQRRLNPGGRRDVRADGAE